MRFPVAALNGAGVDSDFDFGPGGFACRYADCGAGCVFDAGGGDREGGDLVGEGVGPEGWGRGGGVLVFLFLVLVLLGGGGGGGWGLRRGGFLAEGIEEVFSAVARCDWCQCRARSRSRARCQWVGGEGEGGPFVFGAGEADFSFSSCVTVGFFCDG